jgi:predicted RNase H-like nuclease (RuvC/YqgF family)
MALMKLLTANMYPIPFSQKAGLVIRLSIALIMSLSLVNVSYAQELTYYRVINEKGTMELKSALTPAEVKRGYAIVTLSGHIVKEVPAELNDEEYAQLSDERKAHDLKTQQENESRLKNESLLLRYSNVEDLTSERKRKLAEFDVRISILRSNMMSLKDQVERQQSRAANIERTGREVPAVIRNNIDELEQKLNEANTSLKSMKTEKESVAERYSLDITLFNQLIKQHSLKQHTKNR